MTTEEITLIKESWELIKPNAQEAGHLFYEKLFSTAPQVRHLFKSDLHTQSHKLMAMLGFVVSKLHRLEDIVQEVQSLGVRHKEYGAKSEHYEVVGTCLIYTLKKVMQDKWTPALEAAWINAFISLKNVMTAATQESSSMAHT